MGDVGGEAEGGCADRAIQIGVCHRDCLHQAGRLGARFQLRTFQMQLCFLRDDPSNMRRAGEGRPAYVTMRHQGVEHDGRIVDHVCCACREPSIGIALRHQRGGQTSVPKPCHHRFVHEKGGAPMPRQAARARSRYIADHDLGGFSGRRRCAARVFEGIALMVRLGRLRPPQRVLSRSALTFRALQVAWRPISEVIAAETSLARECAASAADMEAAARAWGAHAAKVR